MSGAGASVLCGGTGPGGEAWRGATWAALEVPGPSGGDRGEAGTAALPGEAGCDGEGGVPVPVPSGTGQGSSPGRGSHV